MRLNWKKKWIKNKQKFNQNKFEVDRLDENLYWFENEENKNLSKVSNENRMFWNVAKVINN